MWSVCECDDLGGVSGVVFTTAEDEEDVESADKVKEEDEEEEEDVVSRGEVSAEELELM